MQDLPISYFPIAERQHCSEALQKLFAELEATLGLVPNVVRAFAWREPRFWKWWAHRNDLITQRPAVCGLEDVERLRQHGFRDEDIWDIAEIAAMYNYTNRLASATGWLPNPEYHGLAR